MKTHISSPRTILHSFKIVVTSQLFLLLLIGIFFSFRMTTKGMINNDAVLETDDILLLSFTNELVHHFPPENPGFSNIPLLGYHFFSNFLIAKIHSITSLPIHRLYFQFFPFLLSFLWVTGAFIVGHIRGGIKSGWLSVFFVLFGGAFVYLFHLTGFTQISLNSGFGIEQPAGALYNMSFASSIVFVLFFLLLAFLYIKKQTALLIFLMAFTVGMTPLFKIYGGILLYIGLFCIGLFTLYKRKFSHSVVILLSFVITALTFFVFSGEGNYLIYKPLWAPHSILEFNLPWYGFHEKMYTYTKYSVLKELAIIEIHGLSIFLLGNLGTRFIGILLFIFFLLRKQLRFRIHDALIIFMGMWAVGLPLFFIQSGKVFEIIQFSWYYPILLSFIAASGFAVLFNKIHSKFIQGILLLILFFATIPSSYEIFANTFERSPFIAPNSNFLTSPKYLMMNKLAKFGNYDDTVLLFPPLTTQTSPEAMISWYRSNRPYFSFFADKREYFVSRDIDFYNLPIQERAENLTTLVAFAKRQENTMPEEIIEPIQKMLEKEEIVYIVSTDPLYNYVNSRLAQLLFTEKPYYVYKIVKN